MRSRYTAHVRGRVDYLVATHDPATREAFDEAAAERWAANSRWLGLSVLDAAAGGPDDSRGEVEFAARFDAGDGPTVHHERSTFRRVDGAWVYTDGRPGKPPGRNAPCLCGSGKKYKRCCG